jgi:NAD+ kinase
MNVLICTNLNRDADRSVTERVSAFLTERGVAVSGCTLANFGERLTAEPELLIVLGGDGTILRLAPAAAGLNVPVLGINLGNVGHLCAFSREDTERGLERYLSGSFTIERRMMLDVDGSPALNEAVIHRGANPRPIRLTASCYAGELRGDGLIAATPTGSTAYSLTAGGNVAPPTSERILLTPVCANLNATAVSPDTEISITLTGEVTATLSIDGAEPATLDVGSTVRIRKSQYSTKLVKLSDGW